MNEQQAVAIRDPRDPFSQALSLLFKEAKNPSELKKKYRKEMIPLITQVAFKIGAIDTEKSIAERAIPVFAGVISIYLMEQTKGGSDTRVWTSEVAARELKELFRRGYTMLHELITRESPRGKGLYSLGVESTMERLEHYATFKEDDRWRGYERYMSQRYCLEDIRTKSDFCTWLIEITHGHEIVRAAHQDAFDSGGLSEETVIRRALYNLLFIGKPSLHMDYRKVESFVATAKRVGWRERAKGRYNAFVRGLPVRFKKAMSNRSGLIGQEIVEVWTEVGIMADPSSEKDRSINALCLAVDVPPPGLKSEIKKTLDEDAN